MRPLLLLVLLSLTVLPAAAAAPSVTAGPTSGGTCVEENPPTGSSSSSADHWHVEQRGSDYRWECRSWDGVGARVDDGEGRHAEVFSGRRASDEGSASWNYTDSGQRVDCADGPCWTYEYAHDGVVDARRGSTQGAHASTSETEDVRALERRCDAREAGTWNASESGSWSASEWDYDYRGSADYGFEERCESGLFVEHDGRELGVATSWCEERYRDESSAVARPGESSYEGPASYARTCWAGLDHEAGVEGAAAGARAGNEDASGWDCLDDDCTSHRGSAVVLALRVDAAGESREAGHRVAYDRCSVLICGS